MDPKINEKSIRKQHGFPEGLPDGPRTLPGPSGTPFWSNFGPHIGQIIDKCSKNSGIFKSFENSMQHTAYIFIRIGFQTWAHGNHVLASYDRR